MQFLNQIKIDFLVNKTLIIILDDKDDNTFNFIDYEN
jgi:hypothetical protein